MKKNFSSGDGHRKIITANVFCNTKIEFPVSFYLKTVMDARVKEEDNKLALIEILKKMEVAYIYHSKKLSGKGNYISFSYKITLTNKLQMDGLYKKLKKVKGLKFAV